MRRSARGGYVGFVLLLSVTASCGGSGGAPHVVSDVPAPAPATRASSLRPCRDGCDFREDCDFTQFDPFCPEHTCGPQQGDARCHRACEESDASACAVGESCRRRAARVSDTPTVYRWLCLCDAQAGCASPPAEEGGIAAWRSEHDLPFDLFDHAAAAAGRRLFVGGGTSVTAAGLGAPNPVDEVFVASIEGGKRLGTWREAGRLPASLRLHAMAVVGDRLYVFGGEVAGSEAPASIDRTWSAPIDRAGRLGDFRPERTLPGRRSRLSAVVVGRRLILGGGEESDEQSSFATDALWVTAVVASGRLGPFMTVAAPSAVWTGSLAASPERLYLFAGAVYSIALADVEHGTWRLDRRAEESPAVLRAGVVDDLLVFVSWGGVTATAPIDRDGGLGDFRAGSGSTGPNTAFTFTVVDGAAYLTGGTTGFFDGFTTVRSTSRR